MGRTHLGRELGAVALFAAGVAAADGAATAQDGAASAVVGSAEGVRVFEPSFFATFNPITALDMVEQVPGFTIDDGDDRRGFGANAGNVLINGERPSSSAAVSDELGRIAADRVERIELLRGAQGDMDVRGRTELVNVVLRVDAGQPATYVAEARLGAGDRVSWFGQATTGFRLLGSDVTLDVQAPSDAGRSSTDELVTAPDGSVLELRDEFIQQNWRELTVVASARWRPSARDAASLNLRVSPSLWNSHELSTVTGAGGDPLRWVAGESEEEDPFFAEIGGDWERELAPSLSVKLVGLASVDQGSSAERFDVFTPAGFTEAELLSSTWDAGERIGRMTWTWRGWSAHTLEAGLEGAFTYSESHFDLLTDDGSGAVQIPVPGDDTRVEELRGEAYVTDIWTVSPTLGLETGFTFEASRISQTGDAEQEREFTYPKPRVIATYAASGTEQLRLSLVRDVGQLDFDEFASAVSLSEEIVDLGNENLEPEQTWQARAEWERRLGARSVFTLAAFYDAVESVQDLVAIEDPDNPGRFFTAPGNLGDGVRWGGEIDGAAALDVIGVPNAVLRYEATLQHTSVDDPLTGESRSFTEAPEWSYRVEFRQDLPGRRFSWGWDYGLEGEMRFPRADELMIFKEGAGNLDAFIETTRFGGVTLRLGVDNIFNAVETTERLFFVDSRATETLERLELRDRRFGQVYSVRVSGAF